MKTTVVMSAADNPDDDDDGTTLCEMLAMIIIVAIYETDYIVFMHVPTLRGFDGSCCVWLLGNDGWEGDVFEQES